MSLPRKQERRVAGFDLCYSQEEVQRITTGIQGILETGFISMGQNVAEFERLWAEFCGVRYAVGTANGTCALEIILRAIDVRGRTVIVPSHTFIASAVAAIHASAKVIFVDCQRDNLQMDPQDLRRKIRADTKAVVLVHMSGIISPHLEEIRDICEENDIALVEDAAHAHGAEIGERRAGSLGLAGAFSFFSTKVLTTGEGGMITTNEPLIYQKALALRDHGRFGTDPNRHDDIGYNWRPSELHAVLGVEQMRRAEGILQRRRELARRYDIMLDGREIPGIRRVKVASPIRSSYYKYVLLLEPPLERDTLKQKLTQHYGVSLSGDLYGRPCHSQPLFARHPETAVTLPGDDFPETDYVVSHHICLPLYFDLSNEQAEYVVDALESAARELAVSNA